MNKSDLINETLRKRTAVNPDFPKLYFGALIDRACQRLNKKHTPFSQQDLIILVRRQQAVSLESLPEAKQLLKELELKALSVEAAPAV
jgi:hypothetical protein